MDGLRETAALLYVCDFRKSLPFLSHLQNAREAGGRVAAFKDRKPVKMEKVLCGPVWTREGHHKKDGSGKDSSSLKARPAALVIP